MRVASVHQGRGVGPLGILAMLVIVLVGNYPVAPAGALLVLLWVRWSRTPWRDIGYVRPESWPRDVAVGIAFGIAFKFLMKAVDRKSTRLNSSHSQISYAVFCLKKKKKQAAASRRSHGLVRRTRRYPP